MDTILHDLRYGARTLLKNPGLSLIAVVTLALGIGANTAIFSVVNAVLLQPLPYPEPAQLVRVWETDAKSQQEKSSVSFPCLRDWREQNQSFARIAAYEHESFILTGENEPERVVGLKVSADFLQTL